MWTLLRTSARGQLHRLVRGFDVAKISDRAREPRRRILNGLAKIDPHTVDLFLFDVDVVSFRNKEHSRTVVDPSHLHDWRPVDPRHDRGHLSPRHPPDEFLSESYRIRHSRPAQQ